MTDYLGELIKDTPMGRIKLLAAWDALSSETQIEVLAGMSERGLTKASDRAIWLKALASSSEYIRYLAARETRFDRKDEIQDKILADESPLVRYTRATGTMLRDLSIEDFARCPKELKLAIVSDDNHVQTTKFAAWVGYAVETKRVDEEEIYDVVLEYLSNPGALRWLQESSYDYFGDTESEKGFKALWDLVSKVPPRVAHCLASRLPWRGVLGDEPPSEILRWIETSPYVESLLQRDDVPLIELRRNIFFSTDPKHKDFKYSAVSHHFTLLPKNCTNSSSKSPTCWTCLGHSATSPQQDPRLSGSLLRL